MSEPHRSTPDGSPGGLGVVHPRVRAGRPPVTVSPADTIGEAVSRMREHRVQHVPVVSGGHCVALLTERDVLRSIASSADVDTATARTVGSVCRGPAPAVEAGASLSAIAAVLLASDTEAAVVVSRDVLVGVVRTSDVLGSLRTRHISAREPIDILDLSRAIPRPR